MATPSAGPAVAAAPKGVAVRVVNGTKRVGLAHALGAELLHRGFAVRGVSTSARPVTGPPTVVYGTGGEPAARLLLEHVAGGTIRYDPAVRGVVQLNITDQFTRLTTADEAAAAHTRDLAAASPTAVPTRACGRH